MNQVRPENHFGEELKKYQETQEFLDREAERIDELAQHIYLAKLTALPTIRVTKSGNRFSLLYDALNEIPSDEGLTKLAVAIRDGNAVDAGLEIIRLVTNPIRHDSRIEAEDGA